MKRILLIEDNSDIRENTLELLQLEGYEVINTPHGHKGLELALALVPDLILCDIMMPEMDGYEVLEAIKMELRTSSIPFVFITANVEKKQIEIAFEMGADAYIQKPFEADDLLSTIAHLIDQNAPSSSCGRVSFKL